MRPQVSQRRGPVPFYPLSQIYVEGQLPNGAVKHPVLLADPWFMLSVLGLYLYLVKSVLPQ